MEPKKISDKNLPDGLVLAYNEKGIARIGFLSKDQEGRINCQGDAAVIEDVTEYIPYSDIIETFGKAKPAAVAKTKKKEDKE